MCLFIYCVWGPQDHPQCHNSLKGLIEFREAIVVRERIHIKIDKGKRHRRLSPGYTRLKLLTLFSQWSYMDSTGFSQQFYKLGEVLPTRKAYPSLRVKVLCLFVFFNLFKPEKQTSKQKNKPVHSFLLPLATISLLSVPMSLVFHFFLRFHI